MNNATFTTGISKLPFATPPHFQAWTSCDLGYTLVPVIDERTGKPAQFASAADAKKSLRNLLKNNNVKALS